MSCKKTSTRKNRPRFTSYTIIMLQDHAVYDSPTPFDYQWEDMFWNETLLSDIMYYKTETYNQWLENNPSTKYACTRYWTTHAINENNVVEGSNIITDPIKEWIIAIEKYGAKVNSGDSLRSAVDQARDRKLIAWYAVCKNKEQIMQSLAKWYCLYTWTLKADRNATKRTGVFAQWNSYWHAFALVWYDKDWVIARNSYWPTRSDYKGYKWHFLIKWDDITALFTIYSMIDNQDIDVILAEKKKKDEESKKRMQDLWIRNGQRPTDTVTREECVLMLDRLYTLLNK